MKKVYGIMGHDQVNDMCMRVSEGPEEEKGKTSLFKEIIREKIPKS